MVREALLVSALALLCGCPSAVKTETVELRAVHHSAQNAAADAPRTFTNDLGTQVTLTRAYVTLSAVELLECKSVRFWEQLSPISTAWAHEETSPTRLGAPIVLSLLRADGTAKTLGSLEPPLGSYCQARVELAGADADARDLPTDVDMAGKLYAFEGTYRPAGAAGDTAFNLTSTLGALKDVDLSPSLQLEEEGGHAVLTVGFDYDHWFDGVDFASIDEAARANRIIENVRASLRTE